MPASLDDVVKAIEKSIADQTRDEMQRAMIDSIGHGVKTVAAAGSDEVLASPRPVKWVAIMAQTDNTGVIAVGASGVDATVATGTGVALAAGDSIVLENINLGTIYIDATVSGDGVRYTYGT